MKLQWWTAGLLIAFSVAGAQVASHVSTVAKPPGGTMANNPVMHVSDKPVARVNGVALTDRDLLREMLQLFPYARQHNGFPKELEPEIRRGALEMIIFEELVYQEAQRRNLTVTPARLTRAFGQFRKRFPSPNVYQQFLKVEVKGSEQALRGRIRRSLLIEDLLKAELQAGAAVSVAEAKAYYDKNPKRFERSESFSIQTISIIPPANAGADVLKEARKRAEEALRQAKATGSYREFGLLAEKLSDDDWKVNMGDRKQMAREQLPPPVVEAALKMKPGEVSDLLQFGSNYAIFRLNGHTAAGKADFASVKGQIQSELGKIRYDGLRAEFHKKLRKTAKVEVL